MKSQHCRFFSALIKKLNSTQWQTQRRMRNRKRTLASAVFFGASAFISTHISRAEEPSAAVVTEDPAADESITTLPEVVVPGDKEKKMSSPKYTEPLRDIPQTITIIPQKTMEEQNATTLRDVLRNVPGISIQAGEGGVPAGDNLSIRGFNARTDIFIDGVRDFGGYSRDSFNFEQVEVIKGPASSYSGRGSSGGSINMSSKAPRQNPFANASLGVGTDEYLRTTVDVNQPINEKSAFRLNALWHSQEVSGRDAVESSRWGVAPSLAFGLGTPTRTKFNYFHLDQDNLPDYGIPFVPVNTGRLSPYSNGIPPVNYGNFYGLRQRDYEKLNTDIASIQVEHDINPSLGFRNITQLGRTKRDSVITAPRFVDENPGAPVEYNETVNRQIQSRDQVDSVIANQLDVTSEFDTWGAKHSMVSGLELSQENSKNWARSGPTNTTNLYNPDPNDPSPGAVTRTGARTDVTGQAVGVYAFDTMKISQMFEILGGVRWDSYNVNQSTISPSNTLIERERRDEKVTWRAGLVFKPVEKASVYASYGTAFNPSIEGLAVDNGAASSNTLALDPEESHPFELGTKWDVVDERLSLNAAVFRTEKTNARTENPLDATDVTVLAGEQRVDGIELGASGMITDKWNLTGAYTFMDSEVIKSNNPIEVGRELQNTPEHSASLWTTYMLLPKFDVGLGTQYVGSRWNNTTATRRQVGSYWLADAMLAYRFNQRFTLRLNAYNLADKEYADRLGGGHFIPGTGRSATLTTEVKF